MSSIENCRLIIMLTSRESGLMHVPLSVENQLMLHLSHKQVHFSSPAVKHLYTVAGGGSRFNCIQVQYLSCFFFSD